MKPKKCRVIHPKPKQQLWRTYKLLSLVIEAFDRPKDAAAVRNENLRPVPADMLPIIF